MYKQPSVDGPILRIFMQLLIEDLDPPSCEHTWRNSCVLSTLKSGLVDARSCVLAAARLVLVRDAPPSVQRVELPPLAPSLRKVRGARSAKSVEPSFEEATCSQFCGPSSVVRSVQLTP